MNYANAFDCVDQTNCGKFWKRWEYQTTWPTSWEICEATVRTGHGTTDRFQIGKGVRQGCILSPCLFNLYAEYIMRNPGLEGTQAGVKIAAGNINKLWHCFHCFPIYFPWSDGTNVMIFIFWMLSFKPTFSLSSFTFIKRLLSSSSLSAIRSMSRLYIVTVLI